MLASPIIEGVLPAFYLDYDGTATIAVPFFMNRVVSEKDINGFRLKIKDVQSSSYLLTASQYSVDYGKSIAYFKINESSQLDKFLIGSFYKAQLAYVDNSGVVGYYSTVGIIKYTTKPSINILLLNDSQNNSHIYNYTGTYSQLGKDTTEKVYSYRFIVKDEKNNIIEDTGYLAHNNSTDTEPYESYDTFVFNKDLEINKKYTISYEVKTINNLNLSTPEYKILQQKSVDSVMKADLFAEMNYDNGYVKIWLEGHKQENGFEPFVKGNFILSRTSEKSNYTEWEKIKEFVLNSEKSSSKEWKDFVVEQGVKYKYCIQQYSNTMYSERIITKNPVYVDFEDSFLYDGERQLKIKFNPKISSFKKNLLESKVDTIGSKYPFVFRNGVVEYKEFPIQGLISYLSDEEGLFVDNTRLFINSSRYQPLAYEKKKLTDPNISLRGFQKEYEKNYLFYFVYENKQYWRWIDYVEKYYPSLNPGNWISIGATAIKYWNSFYVKNVNNTSFDYNENNFKSTNQTSFNVALEREFKLEVLNWLTNGKPKLFKSPNEGNYIVRLMNSSLSPVDSVGRMLHNFSSTAYEVSDTNYNSLINNNLIAPNEEKTTYLKIITIPLSTKDENYVKLSGIQYDGPDENGFWFATGNLLRTGIVAENLILSDIEPNTQFKINDKDIIVVGATGLYEIPIETKQIALISGQKSHGLLTVMYYTEMKNSFNQITDVVIKDVLGQQKIGAQSDIISSIKNIGKTILSFQDIRLYKRHIENVSYQEYFTQISSNLVNKTNYFNYYILNNEAEYVIPESFDSKKFYYVKKFDLLTNQTILTAKLLGNNLPTWEIYTDRINPLYMYSYSKEEDFKFGKLFIKITFSDIRKQDSVNNFSRNLINRTSTNPYLYDYKDFSKMVQNKMLFIYTEEGFQLVENDSILDPTQKYFITEPVEYIMIPEELNTIYLTEKCYDKFLDMWTQIRQISGESSPLETIFKNTYNKISYQAKINGEDIDLTTIEYYNTETLEVFNLKTSPGIYCELFYQAQIINYDISQNYSLQVDQNTLKQYDKVLSKEYMLEKCINDTQEKSYINNELLPCYSNYNKVYNRYINNLTSYLKSLDEEV